MSTQRGPEQDRRLRVVPANNWPDSVYLEARTADNQYCVFAMNLSREQALDLAADLQNVSDEVGRNTSLYTVEATVRARDRAEARSLIEKGRIGFDVWEENQ